MSLLFNHWHSKISAIQGNKFVGKLAANINVFVLHFKLVAYKEQLHSI